MTRPAKTTVGAVRQDCPHCGLPTLHQAAGLPLVVTADTELLTVAEALARTTPNRLAWCVKSSRWSGARLIECYPNHPTDCTRGHVIDHECPPGTPKRRRPEGALW